MKLQLRTYSHIAILQTAFIGDVALVLYLAQTLRTLHPSVSLTLVTTPAAASMAQCAPALDTVMSYDKRNEEKGWKGIQNRATVLRNNGVDCILAPHRSLRTTLVASLAHALSIGFDRNAASFLYTRRVAYPYHLHEAERTLQLLSVFSDVEPAFLKKADQPQISLPPDIVLSLQEKLEIHRIDENIPIVVLAPGSVWATKRWPKEYFVETVSLLRSTGLQVILSGSKADEELCEYISRQSGAVSLAGQTDIPETLALLQKASVLLSNDSAPTHFAGLVGCSVITLFGPTSPMFGFAPRGAQDRIIENTTLHCKPCSIHGQQSCPLSTHLCMKSILPKTVVQNIIELLMGV